MLGLELVIVSTWAYEMHFLAFVKPLWLGGDKSDNCLKFQQFPWASQGISRSTKLYEVIQSFKIFELTQYNLFLKWFNIVSDISCFHDMLLLNCFICDWWHILFVIFSSSSIVILIYIDYSGVLCRLATKRSNPIQSTYWFQRSKPFYLWWSVTVRYSQVRPGKAKYSQVQSGTARYSQTKTGTAVVIYKTLPTNRVVHQCRI